MIESFCRPSIWHKCKAITGEPRDAVLCWLKGTKKPSETRWKYSGFYDGTSGFSLVYDGNFGRKNRAYRMSASFFSRNGHRICQAWIDDEFGGNWEKAIIEKGNFENFFNDFLKYFCKRREMFVAKTKDIIKQANPGLKTVRELKPNSHGGVANLLRVLTRTMTAQGSSLRTIAKVQYTICMQAGIIIPDEFITDVLTAADMVDDILNESERVEHNERPV